MHQTIEQQIEFYTRNLRLPGLRQNYLTIAQASATDALSYEDYLLKLLQVEYEQRAERRKKQRLRRAGFPNNCYLQDLDRAELPENAQAKLPVL
jgi:DNA replication protein DnaC